LEHELRAFAEAIDTILGALQAAGRIELTPGGLVGLILVGGFAEALVQRLQSPQSAQSEVQEFIDDVTDLILPIMGTTPYIKRAAI